MGAKRSQISAMEGITASQVSVVIPAYRASAYICEALDSVCAQAQPPGEIIVVNDGSPDTDALEQVLARYPDRITYLKKENGGVSSARNAGIRAARGKWLAFLDADDIWMPNYLEVQLAYLREHPGTDMVFPNCQYFGGGSLDGQLTMDLTPFDGEITFEKALAGECVIAYCALVRREIVIRAGLFDTTLKGSEDFNLWLRILKLGGRIGYHRIPLYRYRRHESSLTTDSVWMLKRILESLQRSEETIEMTPEERRAAERHRRKVQFEISWYRGRRAFEARDWANAIRYYDEAYVLRPSRKLKAISVLLRTCPRLLYNVLEGKQKAAVALSSL